MKQVLQVVITAVLFFMVTNSRAQTWTPLDTNTDSIGSSPNHFCVVGSLTYFVADDGIHGQELWKTDGTASGTVLVKDITPGITATNFGLNFYSVNNLLVFSVTDSAHGSELWKSDGTAAGTGLIKDIYPGTEGGFYQTFSTVVFNNVLYFLGTDPIYGQELWKSDGTTAGTTVLKDIVSGAGSSYPSNFTVFNGYVYFNAYNSSGVYQLWRTDGTTANTVSLSGTGSFPYVFPFATTPTRFFMFTNDAANLWVSDGTQAGSHLVKSVATVNPYAYPPQSLLATVGETAFFIGYDAATGNELWKSDGTAAGTVLVKDIFPGTGSSNPQISSSVVIGTTLYFLANDSIHGIELWKSDGTTAGTILVKDINPGVFPSGISSMCNMGGTLYFSADDAVNGMELWKSDGTTAGTVLVTNISTGAYSSFPSGTLAMNTSTLLFAATDSRNGVELWKSNGTSAGTAIVSNIRSYPNEAVAASTGSYQIPYSSFAAYSAIPANNGLFFMGYDNRYGLEPYFTSGTPASTHLVKDIVPGSNSSIPNLFTQLNSNVYFNINYYPYTNGLWKTDGTDAGTSVVKNISPAIYSTIARFYNNLNSVNGALYCLAYDSTGKTSAVYKSDGTTAGTIALLSNPRSNTAPYFMNLNGNTFFNISSYTSTSAGWWKTDGTIAGTSQVKSLSVYTPNDTFPYSFTPVVINNTMYFASVGSQYGCELWKTDGTTAGTVMVKDIYPGSTYSAPSNFTNVNGTLFFTAFDANGMELWKSDGTDAGTVLVKGNGCNARNLVAGPGNLLYFSATDAVNGTELWKTDGTTAGTVLVKDINTGTANASPSSLLKVGNYLFFFAQDASSAPAYSIFRTDGTAAGTIKLSDFPGNNYALPIYLSGNYAYAVTSAPSLPGGYRLWSSNIGSLLPVQLLSFTAQASKNDAICNWQTTHEINTDHFTVERSTDGSSFTAIGSVNAKGNEASATQSYTYTDYNARQLQYTTLYYRLQSVDKDGSYSYSNIATVSFTDINGFSISPNPASSKVTIKGTNLVTVQLIDNAGKVVLSEQANNSNNLGIDISRLAKGLYFVQMKDSKGNVQTEKLVVE